MRIASLTLLGLGVTALACAGNPKPRLYGVAPSLAAQVEVPNDGRLPTQVTVDMPQQAHMAMFFVVPGGETTVFVYERVGS